MELFLNTIQTGWATDGIYTLIQSSVTAVGITKNKEGTSSLFCAKLQREKSQRQGNQNHQNHLSKKDQASRNVKRSAGTQSATGLHFSLALISLLKDYRHANYITWQGEGKYKHPPMQEMSKCFLQIHWKGLLLPKICTTHFLSSLQPLHLSFSSWHHGST